MNNKVLFLICTFVIGTPALRCIEKELFLKTATQVGECTRQLASRYAAAFTQPSETAGPVNVAIYAGTVLVATALIYRLYSLAKSKPHHDISQEAILNQTQPVVVSIQPQPPQTQQVTIVHVTAPKPVPVFYPPTQTIIEEHHNYWPAPKPVEEHHHYWPTWSSPTTTTIEEHHHYWPVHEPAKVSHQTQTTYTSHKPAKQETYNLTNQSAANHTSFTQNIEQKATEYGKVKLPSLFEQTPSKSTHTTVQPKSAKTAQDNNWGLPLPLEFYTVDA